MTTINISYDVAVDLIPEIQVMLNETALRDINWNGADFQIKRGDFTCIPDLNDGNAVSLLRRINCIISRKED
jgi:hypothetical protein